MTESKLSKASDQAIDWVLEMDHADNVADTRKRFLLSWLQASPQNVKEYYKASAIWDELPVISEDIDLEQLIRRSRLEQGADSNESETKDSNVLQLKDRAASKSKMANSSLNIWKSVSIAATLLICVSLFLLVPTGSQQENFQTAIGEQTEHLLKDGSLINLNTATQITYEQNNDFRLVQLLKGEALFDIKHMDQKPFMIIAGDTKIKVLGTKFNVRYLDESVQVSVLEGLVEVNPDQHKPVDHTSLFAVELAQGEEVNIDINEQYKQRPEITKIDSSRRASWREDLLIFDDQALSQVLLEFNRYYETPMLVAQQEIANLRLSGSFEISNRDAFIQILEQVYSIQVVKENALKLVSAE